MSGQFFNFFLEGVYFSSLSFSLSLYIQFSLSLSLFLRTYSLDFVGCVKQVRNMINHPVIGLLERDEREDVRGLCLTLFVCLSWRNKTRYKENTYMWVSTQWLHGVSEHVHGVSEHVLTLPTTVWRNVQEVVRRTWLVGQDRSVLGIRYVCIDGYWEFGHDWHHDVVDGNSCGNLGIKQINRYVHSSLIDDIGREWNPQGICSPHVHGIMIRKEKDCLFELCPRIQRVK